MATDLRRFTISVTQSMEISLDKAKQDRYYKDTQNEMIRDLINRGLASLGIDETVKEKDQAVRPKTPFSTSA